MDCDEEGNANTTQIDYELPAPFEAIVPLKASPGLPQVTRRAALAARIVAWARSWLTSLFTNMVGSGFGQWMQWGIPSISDVLRYSELQHLRGSAEARREWRSTCVSAAGATAPSLGNNCGCVLVSSGSLGMICAFSNFGVLLLLISDNEMGSGECSYHVGPILTDEEFEAQ
ncbi:unnamed protein product, partial [Prorocentrum cordatum]